MIKTQFGTVVEIISNCGEYKELPGLPRATTRTLVYVEITDPVYTDLRMYGYRFAETLRSTSDVNEIRDAVSSSMSVTLKGTELNDALKEALSKC